jgi:hypothetical protein
MRRRMWAPVDGRSSYGETDATIGFLALSSLYYAPLDFGTLGYKG